MAVNTRNSIVTNGLVLALDAGNTKSLPAPPSTNLMIRSQDFTQSSWLKVRSSVTASAITAPDSTLTGTRLVEDTSNNTHYVRSDPFSFTAGEVYTVSYYSKTAERSQSALQINEANLTFPTVITTLSNGTTNVVSGVTSSIENVGNGWYRTSITRTVVNTGLTYIALLNISGSTTSYQGDGTSGVYVWGVQLEKLPYSTPYIVTTSTTASRNTWRDISGNNYSGSLVNGPTFNSNNGGSIVFDGSNDYGIVNSVDLSNTDKITVDVWIRFTTTATSLICEHSTNFNNNNAFLTDINELSPGGYQFSDRGSQGYNIVYTTGGFGDGKWHNFTSVVDRSLSATQQIKIYADGVFNTTQSPSYQADITGSFSTFDLYLASRAGSAYYYNGNIASFKIYNRALSQQEILQNYNATKTRFGLS